MSKATGVAMEQEIRIGEDGNVSRSGPVFAQIGPDGETTTTPLVRPDTTRLDAIYTLIQDTEADPTEISRLISAELTCITKEMAEQRRDYLKAYQQKAYSDLIKALREMGKQLMDTEVLNKKDILRFDGEKFKFALGQIVALFDKALREAGVLEDQRTSIMKHYRDLMTLAEPQIRRETDKIGGKGKL